MNKSMAAVGVGVMMLVLGCDDGASTAPSREAAALGIASFAFDEGETTLVIEGLDRHGGAIARLDLTAGAFTFDADIDDRGRVEGRQLHIMVRGEKLVHESAGFDRLNLPTNAMRAHVRAFVLDPQVAGALSARGIDFDTSVQPASDLSLTELPYLPSGYVSCPRGVGKGIEDSGGGGWEDCSYAAGANCSNTSSCSQSNYVEGQKLEYRCCANIKKAVVRTCLFAYASTYCGGAGPNGCAPCWAYDHDGTCSAGVTYPSGAGIHMEWCAASGMTPY